MKNLMDDISQSTDSEIYTPEGKSKLPASALKVFERKLRDAFAEEKAAALKEYASNFENTKQDAVDAAVLKVPSSAYTQYTQYTQYTHYTHYTQYTQYTHDTHNTQYTHNTLYTLYSTCCIRYPS